MRGYKDEIIEKFDNLFKQLNDRHALTNEEYTQYYFLMQDYAAEKVTEEMLNKVLPDGYAHYSNCYILRDIEDGEVIIKGYDNDKADIMMRDVSKHICFSDCDGTFEVIKIVYMGREVEYTGWQPGMVMSYEYSATGDEAWSGCFPQWNH